MKRGKDLNEYIEKLEKSEAQYRYIVNNARIAILVAQDYRIKFLNPLVSEITGYGDKELLDKPFIDLIHPDDREMVAERHKMRLSGGDPPFTYSFRIVTHDGKIRWIELNAVRIEWEDKPATLSFLNDITERREAEKALKEYSDKLEDMVEERTQKLQDVQEKLVRREKLAVLGQLSGWIAHELRNPLATISNVVYMLRSKLPDADDKTIGYLDMIVSNVHSSEKIMTDLLDFSRTRPTARAEIDAVELIDEALEKTPPPKYISVETNIALNLPPLYVDPQQIGQVLGNLIANSYQAMPDGGKLTIDAKAKAEEMTISVSDTGCGISRESMSKLFEPLFTTKTNGIGLGLTVCKNLVEVNGGNIDVASEEGKGSVFLITLPTKGKQR